MKHLKTYERLGMDMPNSSDKQYWTYKDSFTLKYKIITTVYKFKEKQDLSNGNDIYIFDGVIISDNKFQKIHYGMGTKIERFEIQKSGIEFSVSAEIMRLSTPEEIDLYLLYSNSNKYNL